MGFTLSHAGGTIRSLPTPEQETIAKANHDHMRRLAINPPIAIGSEKQISWAKKIASQFLFYAHAWQFSPEEIDRIFEGQGKYARFWIENRPSHAMSGELRIAVENLLKEMEADRASSVKSQATISKLTPEQINKMIRRGV